MSARQVPSCSTVSSTSSTRRGTSKGGPTKMSQRARVRQEQGEVELVGSPSVGWRICPYALAYNASSDGTNLVEAGERAGGSAAGVRTCGGGAGTRSGPARHHGPAPGVQRGDAAPEAPGRDSGSGPPGQGGLRETFLRELRAGPARARRDPDPRLPE